VPYGCGCDCTQASRRAGPVNDEARSKSGKGRLVLGWLLLIIGVAAVVLPGPGLLLIAAGLAILAQQYEWARRRLEPVRSKALRIAQASVRNWRTAAVSLALATGLIAVGIVWGWRPAPPALWPVSDRWWLPGGWGTGSSLIGSGLIAIGLLIYSHHRFRHTADQGGQQAAQHS
jgi:hypothetical protein